MAEAHREARDWEKMGVLKLEREMRSGNGGWKAKWKMGETHSKNFQFLRQIWGMQQFRLRVAKLNGKSSLVAQFGKGKALVCLARNGMKLGNRKVPGR